MDQTHHTIRSPTAPYVLHEIDELSLDDAIPDLLSVPNRIVLSPTHTNTQ